jgi:hypothetical protein
MSMASKGCFCHVVIHSDLETFCPGSEDTSGSVLTAESDTARSQANIYCHTIQSNTDHNVTLWDSVSTTGSSKLGVSCCDMAGCAVSGGTVCDRIAGGLLGGVSTFAATSSKENTCLSDSSPSGGGLVFGSSKLVATHRDMAGCAVSGGTVCDRIAGGLLGGVSTFAATSSKENTCLSDSSPSGGGLVLGSSVDSMSVSRGVRGGASGGVGETPVVRSGVVAQSRYKTISLTLPKDSTPTKFCWTNLVGWNLAKLDNDEEGMNACNHQPRVCGLRHYVKDRDGDGNGICAKALVRQPCKFDRCNLIHPVEYPAIPRRASVRHAPVRHAPATLATPAFAIPTTSVVDEAVLVAAMHEASLGVSVAPAVAIRVAPTATVTVPVRHVNVVPQQRNARPAVGGAGSAEGMNDLHGGSVGSAPNTDYPTITLSLPTRFYFKMMPFVDGEGYTHMVEQEFPDYTIFTFCRRNLVDWNDASLRGDKQEMLAYTHTTQVCGCTHFNPKWHGGKKMCIMSLLGKPCSQSPCLFQHAMEYPAINGASGSGTAGGKPQKQTPKLPPRSVMCKSWMAEYLNLPIPSGIPCNPDACRYCHDPSRQTLSAQGKFFDEVILHGDPDNVAIMLRDLEYKITSVLRGRKRDICDALHITDLPTSRSRLFKTWAKAVKILRTEENPYALHLSGKKTIPDGMNVNGGVQTFSDDEAIAFEIARLLTICPTAENMLRQHYGESGVIYMPGTASAETKGKHVACVGGYNCEKGAHLPHGAGAMRAINEDDFDGKPTEEVDCESCPHLKEAKDEYDSDGKPIEKVNCCSRLALIKEITAVRASLLKTKADKKRLEETIKDLPGAIKRREGTLSQLPGDPDEKEYKDHLGAIHECEKIQRVMRQRITTITNRLVKMVNKICLFRDGYCAPYKSKVDKSALGDLSVDTYELESQDVSPEAVAMRKEGARLAAIRRFPVKVALRKLSRFADMCYTRFLMKRREQFMEFAQSGSLDAYKRHLISQRVVIHESLTRITRQNGIERETPIILTSHLIHLLRTDEGMFRITQRNGKIQLTLILNDEIETVVEKAALGNQFDRVDVSLFISLFCEYVELGAYRVMTYTQYNGFMRECWLRFSATSGVRVLDLFFPMGDYLEWKQFHDKMFSKRDEWDQFGLTIRKSRRTVRIYDTTESKGKKTEVLHEYKELVDIDCLEREKYGNNFWAFVDDRPQKENPEFVGQDGELAIQEDALFNLFLGERQGIQTFTEWLMTDPKRTATLQVWRTCPQFEWSLVFKWVNYVLNNPASDDATITLQELHYDSALATYVFSWGMSAASRNVGVSVARAGVTLGEYLRAPEQYKKYYDLTYDCGLSFDEFNTEIAAGWEFPLCVPGSKSVVLTLAHTESHLSSMKRLAAQIWTPESLVSGCACPVDQLTFGTCKESIKAGRTIWDKLLCDIGAMIVCRPNSQTCYDALHNMLSRLPRDDREALVQLDNFCQAVREAARSKIQAIENELRALLKSKKHGDRLLDCVRTFASSERPRSCSDKTWREMCNSHEICVKLVSHHKFLTSQLETDVIDVIRTNSRRDVFSMTDPDGKEIVPPLIATARRALILCQEKVQSKTQRRQRALEQALARKSAAASAEGVTMSKPTREGMIVDNEVDPEFDGVAAPRPVDDSSDEDSSDDESHENTYAAILRRFNSRAVDPTLASKSTTASAEGVTMFDGVVAPRPVYDSSDEDSSDDELPEDHHAAILQGLNSRTLDRALGSGMTRKVYSLMISHKMGKNQVADVTLCAGTFYNRKKAQEILNKGSRIFNCRGQIVTNTINKADATSFTVNWMVDIQEANYIKKCKMLLAAMVSVLPDVGNADEIIQSLNLPMISCASTTVTGLTKGELKQLEKKLEKKHAKTSVPK